VEELCQALREVKCTYHKNWIIQRHGYKIRFRYAGNNFRLPLWPPDLTFYCIEVIKDVYKKQKTGRIFPVTPVSLTH